MLRSRLFARLCEENDDVFKQLLLHMEVRWLSKGLCLKRLVELFESTIKNLCELEPTLVKESKLYKGHLFYIADLHAKLNVVQKKLYRKNVKMIQARTVLMGFNGKRDYTNIPLVT